MIKTILKLIAEFTLTSIICLAVEEPDKTYIDLIPPITFTPFTTFNIGRATGIATGNTD